MSKMKVNRIENTATTAGGLDIDSSGRVGIGTSSPDAELHIGGSEPHIDIGPDAGNRAKIGFKSNDIYIGTSSGSGQTIFKNNISSTDNPADSGTERMRIDSSGNVGIGTSSPARGPLHLNSSTADTYFHVTNSTTGSSASDGFTLQQSGNETLLNNRESGNMRLYTAGSERMRISNDGFIDMPGVYNFTTASGANVNVDGNGGMRRSTSSIKYKTNVETLEISYSDALLNCRPVWYRSTCEADNADFGWWGFIAEEVAEIDPRLVHWKTTEISYDENGSAVEALCDPEPEGVAYDRFVPHLLNLIKRQQAAIETLEQRLTDAGIA